MAASRLKPLAAVVAATGASLAAISLAQTPATASDRGSLEAVRRKLADPTVMVPPREVQESALIGSSPTSPLDMLVVGGGATGCGVALDAVSRGLRVGLVEREDFSSGTSSRSTKLIHGGEGFLEFLSWFSVVICMFVTFFSDLLAVCFCGNVMDLCLVERKISVNESCEHWNV